MSIKEKPEPSDIQAFAINFSILSQVYESWLAQTLEKFAITAPQLAVLSHVSRLPPDAPAQRISDIAKAVDVTQPAVTKMVTKFEALGLVSFHSDRGDKRAKRVQITPAGHARLRQIQMQLFPDFGRWFADWSQEELHAFTAQVTRLRKSVDQSRNA